MIHIQWILCSLKKEETSDTSYSVDESWGHYGKWNKSVTKGQILLWFHIYEVPTVVKFTEIETTMVGARGLRKEEMCYFMDVEFQFYKTKNILEMDGNDSCTTM